MRPENIVDDAYKLLEVVSQAAYASTSRRMPYNVLDISEISDGLLKGEICTRLRF